MSTSNPSDDLRKILTVEQLPAMPHSALTVLQLDNDLSKVDINDLVKPIEADPGLAAQVLKFLNSSYFGFQSTISNIRQGIALVGIRVVKNFVLWKAVFSLIPKSKIGGFDVTYLWQDSLRRAMFVRFLLLELRKGDPELAFAAALLQDIAIPLLIKQLPVEYGKTLARVMSSDSLRLSTVETETFGWTHADAAGVLGQNWKLPAQLTNLMVNHLQMKKSALAFTQEPEQAVVALSALLPSVTKVSWTEKAEFMRYYDLLTAQKPQPIEHFLTKVDQEFEHYALIIQIAKPKTSLSDYLKK